jgi:hypothetical protein
MAENKKTTAVQTTDRPLTDPNERNHAAAASTAPLASVSLSSTATHAVIVHPRTAAVLGLTHHNLSSMAASLFHHDAAVYLQPCWCSS